MNWMLHMPRMTPPSNYIDSNLCSGTMIEAGSETTSMQLNNMILGILSNPDVVRRAHEELDLIVGSNRPPNFHDEPNLPYIRGIIKVITFSSSTY